jgi:hypothetical protein
MHLVYWSTSQYVEPMAVRRQKLFLEGRRFANCESERHTGTIGSDGFACRFATIKCVFIHLFVK